LHNIANKLIRLKKEVSDVEINMSYEELDKRSKKLVAKLTVVAIKLSSQFE